MKLKKWLTLISLLAIGLAVLSAAPSATAQSGNLLQNPGMEQPYIDSNQQGQGWDHYRITIQKPDDASALQYSVSAVFSAETNPSDKFPELIHGGAASQHIGQQQDPWIAGIKQTVSSITPGSQVRFCAYARIFVNNLSYGKAPSVNSYEGRSRVGIYPDGDASGDAPAIVWSPVANPHDTWQQLCVSATVGASGKVTVYTRNDWRGYAAIHLDAWWDDAELVVMGQGPTPQPTIGTQPNTAPQPTTAPVAQPPSATAAPLPDGSIVHTVAAGDTLFGLSFEYNVPLDDILALNNISKDDFLQIGQKIIIKKGSGAAQPTPVPATSTPEATSASVVTPTEQAAVTPTSAAVAESNTAKLCVFAFNDTTGDGALVAGAETVAGVQFAVANQQGVQVASYTTKDGDEPHCFSALAPGTYTVAVQPASGTVATSDKRWSVALTSGATANVNFGSRGDANAPAAGQTATGEKPSQGGSNLSGLVGGAIGLILLLVAGVLGAFIIARRRA